MAIVRPESPWTNIYRLAFLGLSLPTYWMQFILHSSSDVLLCLCASECVHICCCVGLCLCLRVCIHMHLRTCVHLRSSACKPLNVQMHSVANGSLHLDVSFWIASAHTECSSAFVSRSPLRWLMSASACVQLLSTCSPNQEQVVLIPSNFIHCFESCFMQIPHFWSLVYTYKVFTRHNKTQSRTGCPDPFQFHPLLWELLYADHTFGVWYTPIKCLQDTIRCCWCTILFS